MATAQQIITDIEGHIQKSGYQYRDWYVGITGDVEQRVHTDHNVPKSGHWLIYDRADSAASARRVEKHFLDRGCQGGGGGGDDSSVWVYAYVVTSNTRE